MTTMNVLLTLWISSCLVSRTIVKGTTCGPHADGYAIDFGTLGRRAETLSRDIPEQVGQRYQLEVCLH
jgi:hypothetical protein